MGRRRAAVDVIGVAVAVALGALAFVRADDREPSVAILVAAVVGVVVVARILGVATRVLVPAVVTGAAIWVVMETGDAVGPLSGPFGYRNATGAFLAQGAVAALMTAAALPRGRTRALAFVAAVPLAGWLAVEAITASAAAATVVIALAPALFAFGGRRGARAAVVTAGVIFVVTLGLSLVLGAAYAPGGSSAAERALTERRLQLWSEAWTILRDEPGGIGSGRFADVSPTAIRDVDARWAHHEFLEQGAELGWAGLALMVLLLAWGFVRLLVHPDADATVALGAASLAALGMHASVDYILHFPAVPLAAAALVGTAQAVPLRRFTRDHEHDRP